MDQALIERLKHFWIKFNESDKSLLLDWINFNMKTYGTTRSENRNIFGVLIERFFIKHLTDIGFSVESLGDTKRVDIQVENVGYFSLKWSKTGDIKLHNSLGFNRDITFHSTIIITPSSIWLITEELVKLYDISLHSYLKNTGDGLSLKRTILTRLDKLNYKFRCPVMISTQSNNKSFVDLAEENTYKYFKDVAKSIPHLSSP